MERGERKRCNNFTQEEKQRLVCCILKEGDIEIRKTDGYSNKLKKRAWERVANDFNSHATVQRDEKNLKTCWENMKHKLKKATLDDGNADPTILNMLKSSPNLIVTLENSWDGDRVAGAESQVSQESPTSNESEKWPIEYCALDEPASPSLSERLEEAERSAEESPLADQKPKVKTAGSIEAKVAQEKLRYIKWKREQKGKIFDLKMKTQQALLEEATARRDLAKRELSRQLGTEQTSMARINGT